MVAVVLVAVGSNVVDMYMYRVGGSNHKMEPRRLKQTNNHHNQTHTIQRDRLLFFSIHLSPPPSSTPHTNTAFYPPAPSGAADDVAHNIYNVPLTPLWALPAVRACHDWSCGSLGWWTNGWMKRWIPPRH